MAESLILKQGGGVGSDELTATVAQVLSGYTAVTKDSDDEIGTGTMPNRGAVSQALNAGDSYTVPQGYHNGSGKITANSLASQTPANAVASNLTSGKTAWVNGKLVTGNGGDNQTFYNNGYAAGYNTPRNNIVAQGGYENNWGARNVTVPSGNYKVVIGLWAYGPSDATAQVSLSNCTNSKLIEYNAGTRNNAICKTYVFDVTVNNGAFTINGTISDSWGDSYVRTCYVVFN